MKTYYEAIRDAGISRRDFLRFCALTSGMLGLSSAYTPKIARALEQKPRVPVVWLHGMECTGCSASVLRSDHPLITEVLTSMISMDYFSLAMASAGAEAESYLEDTMKTYRGRYILVLEGNVPLKEDGVYCMVAGKPFREQLEHAARDAAAILAVGSCASWGSVQAARPNPTDVVSVDKIIKDVPIIKMPGCPPIADVITGVITYVVTFGRLPDVDRDGRPKMFYSQRVHDKCYRRAHFDAGQFVERWDDEGARRGYCLYKVGCKGPTTYNACTTIGWNGGVSSPIRSGHGCIGCSENNFFDKGPFYERLTDISNYGLESNADKIGAAALGGAAGALGLHALARGLTSVVRKDKEPAAEEVMQVTEEE
jgi:hydrogenase small subunit